MKDWTMLRLPARHLVRLSLLGLLILAFRPASGQSLANWKWIWAGGQAKTPETVFFRQKFTLPKGIVSGRLLITADDKFSAYLNDSKRPVAQGSDWTTVQEFDVTRLLKPGDNVL